LTPSEESRRIEAIRFLLGKGYPKENFKVEATVKKLGNRGRNSVRADLAVLDVPLTSIESGDVDALLEHAVLLGEIKRDNKSAAEAKATQVDPLLDFAHKDDCVALYWDDTEQRIFWREHREGERRKDHEAPALSLPPFGNKITVQPLTLEDTVPTDSLLDAFRRIEDILHGSGIDPEARYGVILQLLLTKLYDEHSHETTPTEPLALQDYKALGTTPANALKQANKALSKAVGYYGKHLPQAVPKKFEISDETLLELLEILAPIGILASSQEVMQTFYMHFAKHLYKWDLAQYFTPVTVSDFIATALSPGFGEHIKDPACGSADFLTSAYRIGSQKDPNYGQCVWGADNSANAVQVAVLNMLLNGDGKSNINLEDSLEKCATYEDRYEIMICNPPFGTQILESRKKVLEQYALGRKWEEVEGVLQPTQEIREKQQMGILFVELCVRQAQPGGRIAVIVPNGYLGNRSTQYMALREWILRKCRVVSVSSFPRFTFKTSGADVSASVLFLEKRDEAVPDSTHDSEYPIHIGLIETVGWRLGDKKAKPVYKRDPDDGSFETDERGNFVLHTDFERILGEMKSSDAGKEWDWLARDSEPSDDPGWSIPAGEVVGEGTLCLDPKRWSRKAMELRQSIAEKPHFRLGDVVDFVEQEKGKWGAAEVFRYVPLDLMAGGGYRWSTMRGWELPDRARHSAEAGDMFLGAIWGSVQKWMLAGGDTDHLLVTNGCHRIRLKDTSPEGQDRLVDLVAAFSSDAYATQMRSFARGSDGLAEVGEDDVAEVLIPEISSEDIRESIRPFVKQLLEGHPSIQAKIDDLLASGELDIPIPARRPSHSVLV